MTDNTDTEKWTFAGSELELQWDASRQQWVLSINGEVCAVRKGLDARPNRLWCHAMAFRLY